MKTKLFLLLLTVCCFGFYSCDDDDNVKVSSEYEYALSALYPNAQRVSWEKKGSYYVAEFRQGETYWETEAWFTRSTAQWKMTVTEINFSTLPQEVKDGFNASSYKTWYVEDVDKVERLEGEIIYVLEVEQGRQEYDLFFSANGTLLKAVPDNDRINKYLNLLDQGI